MCTVTYVPTADGFLFGSNRDEREHRGQAFAPTIDDGLCFPKDSDKGGTWITMSQSGRVLCLLNGAFQMHRSNGTYTKSRGLILLELSRKLDTTDAIRTISLQGIEPFTLVVADVQGVMEMRWDGLAKHITRLAHGAHIWSSCTLYPNEVVAMRQRWFQQYTAAVDTPTAEALMSFHTQQQPSHKPQDTIMMKRPGVCTVSTTVISVTPSARELYYLDHLNNELFKANV
jgi:hypothetical protein